MRRRVPVLSCRWHVRALFALVFVAVPARASAQGLFDFLFGGPSKPAAQQPVSPAVIAPPPALRPYLRPGHDRAAAGDDRFDDPQGRDGSGAYTTVCVRLCDGYYWPLQHGGRRRDFDRDARVCQSSCGEDARLFYMPKSSGIDSAVDLAGKPYNKLATAFLYRRQLINGCACRPSPWSEAEQIRHGGYALQAADARRREDEARRAIEIAAHDGISAPIGSFRAAQDVGLMKRKPAPAMVQSAPPDTLATIDSDWRTSDAPSSEPAPPAAPTRSRRARSDQRARVSIAQATAVGPRPVRAQQAVARATPPPSLFVGSQGYTWPGDRPRR